MSDNPSDTLPVNLPRNLVLLMRELCEIAGIEGGVDAYCAPFFESLLDSSFYPDTPREGFVSDIINGYDFEDPEATEAALIAAISGWEIDVEFSVRRKEVAA